MIRNILDAFDFTYGSRELICFIIAIGTFTAVGCDRAANYRDTKKSRQQPIAANSSTSSVTSEQCIPDTEQEESEPYMSLLCNTIEGTRILASLLVLPSRSERIVGWQTKLLAYSDGTVLWGEPVTSSDGNIIDKYYVAHVDLTTIDEILLLFNSVVGCAPNANYSPVDNKTTLITVYLDTGYSDLSWNENPAYLPSSIQSKLSEAWEKLQSAVEAVRLLPALPLDQTLLTKLQYPCVLRVQLWRRE